MAVHHFTAPDVVVTRGWQPMDTFPQDGTVVEVIDASGAVCRAQWHSGHILRSTITTNEPVNWRHLE